MEGWDAWNFDCRQPCRWDQRVPQQNCGGYILKAYNWLVVSNIFYFHPYFGKIPNLTKIFQMG